MALRADGLPCCAVHDPGHNTTPGHGQRIHDPGHNTTPVHAQRIQPAKAAPFTNHQ